MDTKPDGRRLKKADEDSRGIERKGTVRTDGNKFKEIFSLFIPLLISMVGLSIDIAGIVGTASGLLVAKIVSFIGFAAFTVMVIIIYRQAKVAKVWRITSLVSLFTITAVFFTWVGTWVIPPQVFVDASSFPVEKGNVEAIPYHGTQWGKEGTGNTTVSSSLKNWHMSTTYNVTYDLPDTDSFSGLSLYFAQPIDVSEYRYLEFYVTFDCPDARVRVVMKEDESTSDGVILGDGTVIRAITEEQFVRLDLMKYFPNVSHKSVRKIDFDVNNSFTSGHHEYHIRDVHFAK